MAIPCVKTIREMRSSISAARREGRSVGLVPTMGALHEGHLSLIRRARSENGLVVVSVFVNPTQFDDRRDLDAYPRDLATDSRLAAEAGADLLFSPEVTEMYPPGFSTWVEVTGLTERLCGASRPGHFRGVCTVVAKLLTICAPDRAYFGEKDFQQLAVISRMVRDLNLPVDIVACPTVREPDGLALSSRNARLTEAERAQAPVLFRALSAARQAVEEGERDPVALAQLVVGLIREAPLADIDYVEVVDAVRLEPLERLEGRCLIAVAVRFGGTRLIDNVVVDVPGGERA